MADSIPAQHQGPSPVPVSVGDADPASAESELLINHLWEELGGLYGDTGPCKFTPDQVSGERSAFVSARQAERVVACGAIVPLEHNAAEVKRIFVVPESRRQGIAQLIVQYLELRACDLGFTVLRLETGIKQPGAAKLYESCGFQKIPAFGSYRGDPLSVCFEKKLQGTNCPGDC
ncbi:GNAT family N-acetyltransferase (plasmid) [Verrucomicrobiaceae bacterium 227]